MPGIARLELDVAVRYDHYSDVGHTTNPKIR
jgi:iron complex outermembrane receptor protein